MESASRHRVDMFFPGQRIHRQIPLEVGVTVRSDALETGDPDHVRLRAGGLPDAPEYRISTGLAWRSVPVAQLDRAQVS